MWSSLFWNGILPVNKPKMIRWCFRNKLIRWIFVVNHSGSIIYSHIFWLIHFILNFWMNKNNFRRYFSSRKRNILRRQENRKAVKAVNGLLWFVNEIIHWMIWKKSFVDGKEHMNNIAFCMMFSKRNKFHVFEKRIS